MPKVSTKKTLLALLPLVLMITLWGVNWRRLHPPATAEERAIEALLNQADHLSVVCLIPYPAEHGTWMSMGDFQKSDFESLTQCFRLSRGPSDLIDANLPNVCFVFSKGDKQLISCGTRDYYGRPTLNFYATQPPHNNLPKTLCKATVQRFRNFIQIHPELQKNIDDCMFCH